VNPYDIQGKINAYHFAPSSFTDSEVNELREQAKSLKMPFNAVTSSGGSGLLSQFSSGFTEGVLGPLAFGGWADEAEDEVQSIAHSIGHLLGFALPMAGSLLTFGGSGIARLGLSGVGGAMKVAGQAMKTGQTFTATVPFTSLSTKVPLKSVPLMVGDWGEKKLRTAIANSGWESAKYLTKKEFNQGGKAKLIDMAFQGGHLAVASGVSGMFNGQNDEMDNFLFGAVAGGAFGGLGNFLNTGKLIQHSNPKLKEAGMKGLWQGAVNFTKQNNRKILSGAIGSVFQGGMATLQGAPTATQIYEYALGGFFGYGAHGVAHKRANEYFNSFNGSKDKPANPKGAMDMLNTDAFKELSPEAQVLVKNTYSMHFGGMYDREVSIPGSILADKLRSRYNEKIEEVVSDFKGKKKAEDLEPHEIARAKAELLDQLSTEQVNTMLKGAMAEGLQEAIIQDKKLTDTHKDIVKTLTKTELIQTKEGVIDPLEKAIERYYNERPTEEIKTSIKDIEAYEIQGTTRQPEAQAEPLIKRFLNQLQDKVSDTDKAQSNEILNKAIDLWKDVKPKLNANEKDVVTALKEYKKGMQDSFPTLEFTGDMERGLTQLFQHMLQDRPRPIISFNNTKKQTSWLSKLDGLGKKIFNRDPLSSDEKIQKKKTYKGEPLWGDSVTVNEFAEVIGMDGKPFYKFNIYDKAEYRDTGEWESVLQPSGWKKIMQHLDKQGYYLKIPKKDSGVERVYKIHPDAVNIRLREDLIPKLAKELGTSEKELLDFINYDKAVWLETMGYDKVKDMSTPWLEDLYTKSFKSNYLYESQYNFKSAQARIKRESLMASKSFYQQASEAFKDLAPDGDIDVYAVEMEKNLFASIKQKADGTKEVIKKFLNVKGREPETYWTMGENGKPVEKAWESKVDGWLVMHSQLYKRFMEQNGFDVKNTSHLKPAVAVEIGGKLFLVKGGVHPSRLGYDKAMKNPNSMIIATSAIKSLPDGIKPYNARANKDAFEIVGNKGPSLKIPVEDFRISYGVYGDAHSAQPTTIKKQMHSLFDRMTMSQKGYNSFMEAIHKNIMFGWSETTNQYMDALFNKDAKAVRPKDFSIDKIRYKDMVDIINDPEHPLYTEFHKDIFKKLKRMKESDDIDDVFDLPELKEFANDFETWYKNSDYNPISMVINHKLYEKVIHASLLKKFTHPEWQHSGSGWVAGVDPLMESMQGGVRDNLTYQFNEGGKLVDKKVGHFKLGISHKDMPIDWGGEKGVTLEKGYKRYLTAIKNKEKPELIASMRRKLMFAVMRVPASAISGTRGLLFDGFVDSDVGMADYGVYLRGRDHFYIDGADVDGDKTFFYQGMPKEYLFDLVKNDRQLETFDKKSKKWLFAENKATKFDKLFGSESSGPKEEAYINKNPISQWSPGALRKAGMSAYQGKKGLGQVVNAKTMLNSILSDVIYNNKGKLYAEVLNNSGKKMGTLRGTTSKEYLNNPEGYYIIGAEAHSRTADSANYYQMATPNQMVDIILKSAFKDLKFYDIRGKVNESMEPSMWMLKKSIQYGAITELNSKLYGKDYQNNKAWSMSEVQNALKETGELGFMNSIADIGGKMNSSTVNTDPVKAFNFEGFKKAIKSISRHLFKDKEVLKFITRKNLDVKPIYYHADVKKVIKAFEIHKRYRTPDGRKLSDMSTIRELIWEGTQPSDPKTGLTPLETRYPKLGRGMQKTFDSIFSNHRQGQDPSGKEFPISKLKAEVERDYRINDSYDVFSAVRLNDKGARLYAEMKSAGLEVDGKGNVPWRAIDNIAFKLMEGTKYKDLSDMEKQIYTKWKTSVEESLSTIKSDDMLPVREENDFITLRNRITSMVDRVKDEFRFHYAKEKTKSVGESLQTTEARISEGNIELTKIAKDYGINPSIVIDYFHNYLLSSLRPQRYNPQTEIRNLNNQKSSLEKQGQWEKAMKIQQDIDNHSSLYNSTSIPKFLWGVESISPATVKEFMKGYGDMFDLINKTPPEKIKDDFFMRPAEEILNDVPQDRAEAYDLPTVQIDRLFSGKKTPKVDYRKAPFNKTPYDIRHKVMPSILQTLKRLPDNATLRFEDLYTLMKAEQGFTGTTSIREATFDDIRNFDRFLKEITDGSAPKNRFKKLYAWIFPQTVGERMAGHDLASIEKLLIPVKNIDNSMGLANIKVPISSMSYLQKAGNSIRQVEDAVKNTQIENLFKDVSVKNEIEALDDGINIFNDLFELSIKRMNMERRGTETKESQQFYYNEWAGSQGLYQKYKDKIFKITRDGRLIERSGRDIMTDIEEQMGSYLGEGLYERWIGAGIKDKSGNWKKIDWNIIDKEFKYKEKGLVIHDLIRYDKYGKFDVENFYRKVVDRASTEGDKPFRVLLDSRDNPLSVELLNRVQYEITLEEALMLKNRNKTNIMAQAFRERYRKPNIKGDDKKFNRTAFVGIGRVGSVDSEGRFRTEYYPQMMHDRKKIQKHIANEQVKLKEGLESFFRELNQTGKVNLSAYKIKNRYKPSKYEIDVALGKLNKANGQPPKTVKQIIKEKLTLQKQDFELFTSSRVENSEIHGEWAIEWLNHQFREQQGQWKDLNYSSRPGSGSMRGDVPMPHFSYSFDVLEAYTNQWVGSFFSNMNSLVAKKTITNYEVKNPLPSDVKKPWSEHMRKFSAKLMKRPGAIPQSELGLSKVEVRQKVNYINSNKKNEDKDVQKTIEQLRQELIADKKKKANFKWSNNWDFKVSDQNIVDWLDMKSQSLDFKFPLVNKVLGFGSEKSPSLPLYGKLPITERARKQVLFNILNNAGALEARFSLISLLAHPKTALGNIIGGSQNTITTTGLRNFTRAWDTPWLLTNVFKDAKLKDGTPITDRNTIYRFITETGALESFYVTEAQMDRRFDLKKMTPFFREVFKKLTKDPMMSDKSLMELQKKHKVFESFVQAGGYFMRTSERKLRGDAFIAHYLHARETLSQLVPNMAFDNPYLLKMALKGVEASQFLYHNVSRPEATSSAMGKVLTRFQPFAWNSIRFRKHTYKMAKRYGFTDQQSMDRLRRMMTQDLTAVALANIFVGSIFDSTLPPPYSWMQDTANWLFGDETERERAFYSSYPVYALAPLQVVTAPVHRYWMPALTATINGDWEDWVNYYVHTLYPLGRIGRSIAMTLEAPEMAPEYMFGVPVHALGKKIRKNKDE